MNQGRAYGLILLAGCLWGTQGVFMRVLSASGATSAWISFVRMGLSFLILLIVTLIREGITAFRVSRRTLASCVLLGLFSQAVYNYTYITAVNTIGMGFSAVLLFTAPVFTCLISRICFRESIGLRKAAALALNVCGCALAVTGGHRAGVSVNPAGILLALAAALW
ncbi:MAG: EamA family transporter [Mogibacterium sp.]|nr:EamA family transporter [Mogibacterium sp.]